MRRYEAEANVCIREFYLFEIIHYLIKSTDLFEEIYDKLELYVSSEQRELIDVYRINNYITGIYFFALRISICIAEYN